MLKELNTLKKKWILPAIWFLILTWVTMSAAINIINLANIPLTFRDSSVPAVATLLVLMLHIIVAGLLLFGVVRITSWARWVFAVFAFIWIFADSFFFVFSLIALVLYVYLYDEYMALSLRTVASRLSRPKQ